VIDPRAKCFKGASDGRDEVHAYRVRGQRRTRSEIARLRRQVAEGEQAKILLDKIVPKPET
jgi:hypothetical protein